MKDLFSLALLKIGFFKIVNIKTNFSKLENRQVLISINFNLSKNCRFIIQNQFTTS